MGAGSATGTMAAVLLLVASAACGPGPAARPPEQLVVALRADVSGFYPNPPTSNESFTFEINRWIFESLVAFDPALNLVPWLAERWLNPDDRTYRFELRPGLRFSDGSPLGARVDRHAQIGRGHLGLDAFRCLVNDPRFVGLPMVIETPRPTPDADRINLDILRALFGKRRVGAVARRLAAS